MEGNAESRVCFFKTDVPVEVEGATKSSIVWPMESHIPWCLPPYPEALGGIGGSSDGQLGQGYSTPSMIRRAVTFPLL